MVNSGLSERFTLYLWVAYVHPALAPLVNTNSANQTLNGQSLNCSLDRVVLPEYSTMNLHSETRQDHLQNKWEYLNEITAITPAKLINLHHVQLSSKTNKLEIISHDFVSLLWSLYLNFSLCTGQGSICSYSVPYGCTMFEINTWCLKTIYIGERQKRP